MSTIAAGLFYAPEERQIILTSDLLLPSSSPTNDSSNAQFGLEGHVARETGYYTVRTVPIAGLSPNQFGPDLFTFLFFAEVRKFDSVPLPPGSRFVTIPLDDFLWKLHKREFGDASTIIAGQWARDLHLFVSVPGKFLPVRPEDVRPEHFGDISADLMCAVPPNIRPTTIPQRSPTSRYAWQDFRHIVQTEDWRLPAAPSLGKAYALCLLSELAYEYIPDHELEQAGRLKLIPCERYERALSTRDVIAMNVWRELESDWATGFTIQIFEGRLFQSTVITTPEVVFAIFRGTKLFYVGDWAINLRSLLAGAGPTDKTYLFHSGFLFETLRCAEIIFHSVNKTMKNNLPIYAAGHSLGGAVANIMGTLYPATPRPQLFGISLEGQLRIAAAYAFASPRFGNLASMDIGRKGEFPEYSPFNFRDKNDVVPYLPPAFLGYANPRCEYDWRGNSLNRGVWQSLARLPALRAHSVTRLRGKIGRAIGLHRRLPILPRKSPEREDVLRSI
jgi:hypothetical protein